MKIMKLTFLPLLLGLLASPADGAGDEIRPNEIRAAIAFFNRFSKTEVAMPSGKEIDEILRGDVAKRRVKTGGPDDPQRAIGYILIDEPRQSVWLAALDPTFEPIEGLSMLLLADLGRGNADWYHHLDLPWPIADRHWIIKLRNTINLSENTRGRAWEQTWTLAEDGKPLALRSVAAGKVEGLDLETARNSIYTPVNHGAWIAIKLREDKTLLIYHVTTVVGGLIPDSFVLRWAMATLDDVLNEVKSRAPNMVAYQAKLDTPWTGGDGEPMRIEQGHWVEGVHQRRVKLKGIIE